MQATAFRSRWSVRCEKTTRSSSSGRSSNRVSVAEFGTIRESTGTVVHVPLGFLAAKGISPEPSVTGAEVTCNSRMQGAVAVNDEVRWPALGSRA